ncbi:MAG: VTT domain-containing protein [Thioalkalivibrio sp.]
MNSGKLWLRIGLALLLLTGIVLAIMNREAFTVDALETRVAHLGIAGPLLFMAIYALAAVFFLPGSVLTLAGGALFGPLWGTLYALVGATLGATLAFLVSRHLAGHWVRKRMGGRLSTLVNGVEREGWRFVAFTRLVPLFPYNLLNYALGLTRIRLLPYVLASFVCMAPGALAYTWLGYAGREAVTGSEDLIRTILIALAVLAAAMFLPRLVTRLRSEPELSIQELKEALAADRVTLLDVRSPEEYAQGHVQGAVPLPLDELLGDPERVAESNDKPLAIICRTDQRSAKACRALHGVGVTNARVVAGGVEAWTHAGLPLSHSKMA